MNPHRMSTRWFLSFAAAFGVLVGAFAIRNVLHAAPAAPAANPAATPLKPEPKEYADVSGSGLANGFRASAGPKCNPPPPAGSMTFSGGEMKLDDKVVTSIVIGENPTKPAFKWIGQPPAPQMKWTCGGGGKFLIGTSYGVAVSFANTSRPCGAFTFVAKPATVNAGGGIFVQTNEAGSGVLYLPKLVTTTEATAKSNPNNWRKKIGVGEKVDIVLTGAPTNGTVDWALSGGDGGCTIEGDGSSATFTAGDEATSASIIATFTATVAEQEVSGSASTVLTIVIPTGRQQRKLLLATSRAAKLRPFFPPVFRELGCISLLRLTRTTFHSLVLK